RDVGLHTDGEPAVHAHPLRAAGEVHGAGVLAGAAVVRVGVRRDLAAVGRVSVAVGVAGEALVEDAGVVHALGLRVGDVALGAGARPVGAHQPLGAGVAALAAVLRVAGDDRLAAVGRVAVAVGVAHVALLELAGGVDAGGLRVGHAGAGHAAAAAVL